MSNVQTLTVTVLNRSLASLGTITTALTASGDHYAERVGSGSFTFPAADEDAKALIEDANAYAVQITAALKSSPLSVDIAAFIIDDEEEIVTGDERLAEMAISGPDLLQELAEQSLGYNVIDSSGNPDTSDVTNIMTYHSGWGVSFVPSGTGTDNGSYLAASGETVLEALLLTREKSGDHFRRSAILNSRTIEWVKTADSTGITLQMPSPTLGFTPSATVGFIMGIRRSERKLQKYTRVHCTGAGLGDGRLTLEPLNSPTFHTQPTPPAGYSVDWTGSIITNTSLETALGYEIERYEQFGTIRAQDSSDEFTGPLQLETAALDLYRAGLTFLQEHDSDEEFLEITAVLHNEVKPAQTIVLSYTNPYTDMALSGTYFIHEVRYRYGRDGILTADLLLSQNITRTPPGTELESHAGVIKKIDEIIRHTGAGTSTGTPITPPSSYQLSLSGAVDDIFQISAPGGPSQTLSFDVTAKGSIIAGDATNFIKLAVGANDTVLVADSAQVTGLKWDGTIVRNNITLTAGAGLTGGGDLTANRTFDVGAGAGITVNADDVALTTPGTISATSTNDPTGNHTHALDTTGFVPGTRLVNAGAGLTGGGALSADITINAGAGSGITVNADDIALTTPGTITSTSTNNPVGNHTHAIDATIATSSNTITAGAGLTGGGAITSNPTIDVGAGSGITVNANDVALTTPGTISTSSTNNPVGNHTHALDASNIVLTTRQVIAGAGLSGGGPLSVDVTLNVGAGAGINVLADTVALNLPGTLSVSSTSSAAGNHTHAITSSSNPGAAASILASAADGGLQLLRFGLGIDPDTNNAMKVVTNGWIGLGAAAGRIEFDDQINDIIRIYDADLHLYNNGADRLMIRRSGDVATTESDIYANNRLGLAADDHVGIFVDANNDTTDKYFAIFRDGDDFASGTELFRLTELGPAMFLNATGNTGMTVGLTIDQTGNDDQVLAFGDSTDVGHGMSTLAQTHIYGHFGKEGPNSGGINMSGYSEASSAIRIVGYNTTENTGKSATAVGGTRIESFLKSGTTAGAHNANANIFVVRESTSTRFIVDAEGDIHYDGTNNAGAWDEYDDVGLIRLAQRELSTRGIIESQFDNYIKANKQQLEAGGLVTFNEDGHHFVNLSAMQRLHAGAIWQLHERVSRLENMNASKLDG